MKRTEKLHKYTICLIKRGEEILLLNRNKSPLMGMWNGVGGKIEEDETPYESVTREIAEETGMHLRKIIYKGSIIFKDLDGGNEDIKQSDGMYLFVAELPDSFEFQTPFNTREGILEWKAIDWILDHNNRGVISNLKEYLQKVLKHEEILEHTFLYDNYIIMDYLVLSLKENDIIS